MLALVDDAPEMLPDVLLKGLLAEPLKGLLLNDELLNERTAAKRDTEEKRARRTAARAPPTTSAAEWA